MNYLSFTESQSYPLVFLVPQIRKDEIISAYLDGFHINKDEVLIVDLHYNREKKNTPIKEMREYLKEVLLPYVADHSPEYLIVADGNYFKVLTGAKKIDANLGYILDIDPVYEDITRAKVIYVPNYKAIFYSPEEVRAKISLGMTALLAHRVGLYSDPGRDIIKSIETPETLPEIRQALDKLLVMDVPLTVDIEGFSLKPTEAGIGTIAFAWNKHEGIAFKVDYEELDTPVEGFYGQYRINKEIRELLKNFFEKFKNIKIFHNITYDITCLIYHLYMDDITDTEGLLKGMDILLRNWEDTKLIAYLATNSCAGNNLSLKDQAQEFAGNYAEDDIKDIRRIPPKQLLTYNLVDCLSTWFTYEKRWNQMVADQQLDLYQGLFKDAVVDIVQMQLTGMPLNMERVLEVEKILQKDSDDANHKIQSSPLVQEFVGALNENWVAMKNVTLKKKKVTLADAKEVFNPSSPLQLQNLLYEQIGLPIIDLTTSKQPATGGSVLEKLKNHTKEPRVLELLDALIDLKAVDKILSAFIPAFKNAERGKDDWHYLIGGYNLGGTVSGRLSSNNPNMQQLPSGGKYGKLIKSCFQAPPGFLLTGLDFDSLEDKISALTTKDRNKLKVYLDNFDGHSLRAYSYFQEQMPDINPDSVESINSIQVKYPDLRQESKNPTFACTYGGTYITMMKNLGWSEEKSKEVEERYKELYAESVEWVNQKLTQATYDGYVTAAFGLRVRTPLLHQVIRGNSKTPYEAEAEGRTAGNALGQSWCLLNSRAASEFMKKVRASEYRLKIKPAAQIHDASYYIIPDDMDILQYLNKHLVKAVQWQDDPAIYHPEVKLGGKLSVFFPSWAKEMTIPNYASDEEIQSLVDNHIDSL